MIQPQLSPCLSTLNLEIRSANFSLQSVRNIFPSISKLSQSESKQNLHLICIAIQAFLTIEYERLRKGKKTCCVLSDIPIKVLVEFLSELTTPIASIYGEAINTWSQSYKIPIIKVPSLVSEDDLRYLGLTPFFSKQVFILLPTHVIPIMMRFVTVLDIILRAANTLRSS